MPISVMSEADARRQADDEDEEPGRAEPEARAGGRRRAERQHRADGTRAGVVAARAASPTLSGRCSTRSPRSSRRTLADVRQRGTLTEDDINEAMREIRLALLEADVNFKVVKQFTSKVKERALGADVLEQLNPGQQVVKIVNEELDDADGRRRRPGSRSRRGRRP